MPNVSRLRLCVALGALFGFALTTSAQIGAPSLGDESIRTADVTVRGLKPSAFPQMRKLADNVYVYSGLQVRTDIEMLFTTNNLVVVTRDGVLVAEVSASYNGPHRSSDLRCYVRKGTNSVPVGMREIHDMVMRLSRRQDEIRQRLAERRELFHAWIPRRLIVQNLQVAFRVTAIPVGAPLYQDRIFGNRLISQPLKNIVGNRVSSPSNAHTQRFEIPMIVGSERPILGGTRWADSWDQRSIQQVILRDGIVDVWFKCPWYNRSGHPDSVLFFDWIIAASANVLVRVDSFREAAQAPMCEYGLEVEILSTNGAADCAVQLVTGPIARLLGSAFETPAILGRYSVGDRDRVMNLIARDLQEACGVANDQATLEIDWSA
jgi:hypothetical protein